MAGDLPFVFPRATVLVRKRSLCVTPSLSLSLSLPQLAPLCGLLFWSFMRTLLLFLLVFLFTSSAHFVARLAGLLSPASSPFGAIVLVKLTICIQLRYALCPAADEARLSAQKYAQDTHSDSSPFPLSLSLSPSYDASAFVGSFIFICFVITIFILFSFVLRQTHSQYLCRYIRICCCSCWLLNAIAATNLIWP